MKKIGFRRPFCLPPCDKMHAGNGIDPRLVKKQSYRIKNYHRQERLCKKVAGVLAVFFLGACCGERLSLLGIKSVAPAPDTSCLRVTVFPLYDDPQLDPEAIILILKSAKSYLRKEVVAETIRRRIPDFTFRVIVDPDCFLQIKDINVH